MFIGLQYSTKAFGAGYPQAKVARGAAFGEECYIAGSAFADVEYIAMQSNSIDMSETVIPFAPARGERVSTDHDPLDQAGQSIMGLLQQAATAAKENCGRALRVAHGLSLQLRAAEDQIKALEAELRHFQDRAERAENWLQRISREIETRFFEPSDGNQPHIPARQNVPYSRKV